MSDADQTSRRLRAARVWLQQAAMACDDAANLSFDADQIKMYTEHHQQFSRLCEALDPLFPGQSAEHDRWRNRYDLELAHEYKLLRTFYMTPVVDPTPPSQSARQLLVEAAKALEYSAPESKIRELIDHYLQEHPRHV